MKRILITLTLVLFFLTAYSQNEEKRVVDIYFDYNEYVIDANFQQNAKSLENLSSMISEMQNDPSIKISQLEINSYTSPEGGKSYNAKLAERRFNSIREYLRSETSLNNDIPVITHGNIDWDGLYSQVEESQMEYRDEVLYIIKEVPEETWAKKNPTDKWESLIDSRNKQLMDLGGGKPYKYMFDNLYADLRRGSVITIHFSSNDNTKVIEDEPDLYSLNQSDLRKAALCPLSGTLAAPITEEETFELKPLLAVKTNLLFDAATLLNVEVEVPVGNRWSFAGEWNFPWWSWYNTTSTDNRYCLQLLNGNIEAKYWLGDRTNRPVMTGWYASLYAGGGLYDFEYKAKGYQGEFFIASGLSAGYAHTINKSGNLRMEYSLGIGYLKTNYRYYESMYDVDDRWHSIRQINGNYTWFGPTRARVSLVWLINRKVKGGIQ